MVAIGIAVLAGITRVEDPYVNFHHMFQGSHSNLNSLATAFVKINYTFVGWHNAFNVMGEIKSADPVRTIRKAGFISLALASFLFFFINLAYVAAIPLEELRSSGQLVAALFFRRVLGDTWGAKVLPVMVTLSCFGSLVCNLPMPNSMYSTNLSTGIRWLGSARYVLLAACRRSNMFS